MGTEEFLQEIRKSGLSLRVENEKLILESQENEFPKEQDAFIKNNEEIINYIRNNKTELIKYFSGLDNNVSQKRSENISSLYRLSDLQEGMLFHGLYEPGSGAYVEQFGCELTGVEIDKFIAGWAHLIRRHSILRSGFEYDTFKVPVQCVYKEAVMPVELLDYSQMNEAEQAQAISDYKAADRRRGFDFKKPPLMRIALLRLSEERYYMLWSHHHILSDGWSGSLLMGEFLTTYESLVTGAELPEVHEDRYEDYIRYIERRDKHKEEQYWRGYLEGMEGGTLLPFISTRAERNKGLGHYKQALLLLDEDKTAAITEYTQRHRITINTLMQGVWSYLLHRYTGNPHVAYGVTVSGRPDDLPGVEERVGLYINTLPLHSVLEEELAITQWLQSLQQQQLQSREYQYSGINKIQRWAGIQGDLFDTLFVFENYPVSKVISSRAWLLEVRNMKVQEQHNYPLGITIGAGSDIRIAFNYNADLIEESYIQQLPGHFEHVLLQIIEGRALMVGELDMITEAEQQQLLFNFNDTGVDYPRDKTIIDLFYEQAARTPDNIAVIFEDQQFTYRQLDERSNQLAHLLRFRGVREDSLVVICMERSLEMIIGILGILKAGGAYVPVDPDYPQERIAYILHDTAAPITLTAGKVRLPETNGMVVVNINTETALIDAQDTAKVNINLVPSHLAYVIYTSGSTGRPKGIEIGHSNAVAFLNWAVNEFKEVSFEIIYATTSYCFDLSIFEFFLPLILGKTIRVLNSAFEIQTFLLQDSRVMINTVPSAVGNLIEQGTIWDNVIALNMAGEAIPASLKEALDYVAIEVRNLYGPSECTTYSTVYRFKEEAHNLIPIGKPIANTQIYILGPNHDLVPVGVTGEICIGGEGLARGYLNRPDLTAEKFIPHPFSTDQDARIYRTGDLGRWLPDGNIEFLGRMDDQVKIRGYRIEPGEIESTLVQTGQVQQAIVLCKEDFQGSKRLIGYVVPAADYKHEEVVTALRTKLPEYMVPGLLIELETLPLTPNGKTDRKALLEIDLSTARWEYEAPEGQLEIQLATIWSNLLGVERIGRQDHFFRLGGHSLLAMRLVAAIRTELRIELALLTVFNHPTIVALAAFIAAAPSAVPVLPAIQAGPRPTKIPLSFSQERLWFIDALEGSLQYHIPIVLRLKGELDSRMLEKALRTIINRHEVLRTVIKNEDGLPYQHILDQDGWQLSDPGHFIYTEKQSLTAAIDVLIQRPFNLSTDYLFRADLIQTAPTEHLLVGTMHHIVSDGWSTPILVRELTEIYNALVEGRPYQLPELPVQYADYAIWQRQYLTGDTMQNKLAYWQQQLAGAPVLQLPTDRPRRAVRSTRGASISFQLDNELSGRLERLSLESGATLYMTLLSVFNILLFKYSGQEDICIGSPIAGRQIKEIEGLIGFFVNTLVVRSQVSPDMSFRDLLLQVKQTTLDAYANQDIPFEKIVEAVVTERDMSRNPLFDVMFVLQNNTQPDSVKEALPGLSISFKEYKEIMTNFDLVITLQENAGEIRGSITYNRDLYDHETIRRMVTHYKRLFYSVVSDQDQPVGKLEMITEAEQQQLLFNFNDTGVDYPRDKTIIDLFYEQAAKTPDNIAVIFEDQQLTYRQLDERSNQLGHLLQSRGVREDSLVVICMERSLEMIIGILGILKAGGAYVPVDPDYPQERIAYILHDTAAPIALTAGEVRLPETNSMEVVNINTETAFIDAQDTAKVNTNLLPTHLAYVIYTSGSTGQPKGVMIEHGGLGLFFKHIYDQYLDAPSVAMAFTASYTFDISVFQLLTPLLSGGKSIVVDKQGLGDIAQFAAVLQQATIIDTVPTVYNLLVDHIVRNNLSSSFKHIQKVFIGGDMIPDQLLAALPVAFPAVDIIVLYGPTETTIFRTSLCYQPGTLTAASKGAIIGRPIANTQIYILDPNHDLVPVGVTGEVCIGGAGLARGYLNRPDLTAEKFIPHPFSTDQDARIYRTGDLGRWLPDGNIEFLGRMDDQVKIRGYRIELGEIESVLLQTGQVQQAVVLCKEDAQGNKRLIAYVVPAAGYERESALAQLRTKLPEYMVPGLLVELEALPLTPNGKTDRKVLQEMDLSATAQLEYEAPEGPLEVQLTTIWSNLLKVERISRHDNFFQLGGHSLLAMQLVAAIRKELSIGLSVAELFKNPTIKEITNYIKDNGTKLFLNKMSIDTDHHIFPISSGNKGKIIFFTPGIKGICGGLEKLAQALASDYQIYGLHMMGLFENEVPFKTMEEVAEQNIKWIKTIQPDGPYCFVGHSYAGYYVYEMAKQLAEAGEEIDLAMIIDQSPHYPDPSEKINSENLFLVTQEMLENYQMIEKVFPDWTEKLIETFKGIPMEEVPLYFEKALIDLFPVLDENIKFAIRAITLQTNNILMRYEIKEKINAEGIVIAASDSPYEDLLGWSNYFEKSSFFVIDGDHGSVVAGQAAVQIAHIIKEQMELKNKES